MFFKNLGHRDKKVKLLDQFIDADEIAPDFFKKNHAKYLGPIESWTSSTNMSNGKEGYLCKVQEKISQEAIERMAQAAREERRRSKKESDRRYFEKLHSIWGQQEYEPQQSQLENQQQRNQERTRLNVPTLQTPPSYRYSQRDYNVPWHEEDRSWTYPPPIHSPNAGRFTRSTPATPVSPRDSCWLSPNESRRPPSPVSPISSYGDYPGFNDQYQRRPPSSMYLNDQHGQSINSRIRPKSAINLGQSSTAQKLLGVSHGSFTWT